MSLYRCTKYILSASNSHREIIITLKPIGQSDCNYLLKLLSPAPFTMKVNTKSALHSNDRGWRTGGYLKSISTLDEKVVKGP